LELFVAGIGDISFYCTDKEDSCRDFLGNLMPSLKSSYDIVIGNLEGPLAKSGNAVTGKCVIGGSPEGAGILRKAGIGVVCLANNHMMDFGVEGLSGTIEALESENIRYFGAGKNEREAYAARLVEIKGKRLALLGRTAVEVSSPSYASADKPGVAPFNFEEAKATVRECRRDADFVILSIHWSLEGYAYPTPIQRKQATQLIAAGANLILGHHPHVLQGVERVNRGLVSYSLGNLLFNDVRWSFVDKEGHLQERVVRLGEANRKGGILKVAFSENGIESYDFIPTLIQADGMVILDGRVERKLEFGRLCSRLHWPGYGLFWKAYSIKQEWLLRIKPLIYGKMTWSKIKKIRPRHFKELGTKFKRSARITAERSTNPYE
jgi:poly-gamma-glutamate synthesis protein (capsule biosynthesis protein)